ncbi:MAG TPA: hypothetical protein PKC45_13255, partial [Gemmatales bacterium]|nr:hypothetical protein [Gemmatales bacterium]
MAEGSKSKGGRPAPGPFDVKTIHYLVRLMGQHDLSQIDLRDGDKQVRLQRGTKAAPAAHGNPGPAVAPAPAASAPPTAPANAAAVLRSMF